MNPYLVDLSEGFRLITSGLFACWHIFLGASSFARIPKQVYDFTAQTGVTGHKRRPNTANPVVHSIHRVGKTYPHPIAAGLVRKQ